MKGDNIWGVKAGTSLISGYYNSKFKNSIYFGFYTIPYVDKYFMGEVDFSYFEYPLKINPNSKLNSYSLTVGPLIYYQFFSFFQVYFGTSISGKYILLKATKLEEQIDTFKPGIILKSGIFLPSWKGISLRTGYEYSLSPLSGKAFHGHSIYAGISYNYKSYIRAASPSIDYNETEEFELYFRKGVKNYKNGNLPKSRKNFEKVLSIYKDHKNAKRYIELIKEKEINNLVLEGIKAFNDGEIFIAEETFKKVIQLEKENKKAKEYIKKINETINNFLKGEDFFRKKIYYKSLPYYLQASLHMKLATKRLKEVRKHFIEIIPKLEKKAINLYEKKKYKHCINLLEKLKLMDPNNRVVKIYLSRAKNKYEGLQKLK